MRQGLLSEPKASSDPAAMLLAVSRSPSSIPRRSPCPVDATSLWRPSSTSTLQNLNSIHDCIHSRTDATFLWRTSLHPPTKPQQHPRLHLTPDRCHLPLASLSPSPTQTDPSFSSVPLYLQQNKKSPVPSKYNTTRHQRKKNKCQADIHNPLRYLLITE